MLTGLYKPSSGTAIVNGYDIRTGMNSIRSSLGICPQVRHLISDTFVVVNNYFALNPVQCPL